MAKVLVCRLCRCPRVDLNHPRASAQIVLGEACARVELPSYDTLIRCQSGTIARLRAEIKRLRGKAKK